MSAVMEAVRVTPGRIAYEADVAACPLYHDGTPRKSWHELDGVVRHSWERDPTPRNKALVKAVKFELKAAQAEWERLQRIRDASPNLLEALQRLCDYSDEQYVPNVLFANARSAIARATVQP